MTNLYQSDPAKLSDEELISLRAELDDEYCRSGAGEAYWTDDAAESRYYQLGDEQYRRKIASGWIPPKTSDVVKAALEAINKQLSFTKEVSAQFDREFASARVGDTLTIRRPYRFQGVA